jgi:hypothetical protein
MAPDSGAVPPTDAPPRAEPPTVGPGQYFERAQRGDPQRRKVALVATAHCLVRVMWALLRRGTLLQEKRAPVK